MATAKKKAAKKKPAAKKTKKKETALAKQDPKAMAEVGMFDDSGLGFEDADKDSYSIPFLSVLQKMSPQCDKDAGEYIKGAEPGMFFNTATQEVLGDEILVVPCAYVRQLIEWTPRDQGGGFRGAHAPESMNLATMERDESGRFVMENGNHLMDTRYHFCLYMTDEGPRQAVVSMSSTQIKTSRNWMTAMRDFRAENPKTKKKQTVPMMANIWKLSTITQSNDKGTWKGIKFEHERLLNIPDESDIYLLGKEFNHQIATGKAQAETPEAAAAATGDSDPLF